METHMTAIPYEFLGYTIKPNVVPVVADQSPSRIPKIPDWSVLKNGELATSTVFRTSQQAEEWLKQQSQNR